MAPTCKLKRHLLREFENKERSKDDVHKKIHQGVCYTYMYSDSLHNDDSDNELRIHNYR